MSDRIVSKIHFVQYDRLVKNRILAMVPSADLLKMALANEKSERTPPNLEARESILIELFSRCKNKKDISNQIAYLEKGDLELFKDTLLIPMFVEHLKNAMQSSFSNLEHRHLILDAWMGTPKTETIAHFLDEELSDEELSEEELDDRLKKACADLDIEMIQSLGRSLLKIEINKDKEYFQKLPSTERSEYLNSLVSKEKELVRTYITSETLSKKLRLFQSITKFLPEMNDSEIKNFANFLLQRLKEGENTPYILEIFAIIIPRMEDSDIQEITPYLASYLTHEDPSICNQAVSPIKILVHKLNAEDVKNFIIQPLIAYFNRQVMAFNSSLPLYTVTNNIIFIFKAEPAYAAEFIEPMLNALSYRDPTIYNKAIDIFHTMTFAPEKYPQIIDALLTKFKESNEYTPLGMVMTDLLPHMTKPEIQLYMKYILEKINSTNATEIQKNGWLAANTLIPMLSDSADIQQFIQPILGALGNQDDIQIKKAAREAANTLIPMLSDSADIQQFIQPVLDASRNRGGEVEAAILLAILKEPFTDRPIRLNHAVDIKEANLLSYLIISNKASEQFKSILKDIPNPDTVIHKLQILQQQWNTITSKEQTQNHKQTLNNMKQLDDSVEDNNKMNGMER